MPKEWWAPNATIIGYSTRYVRPGSLILYRESPEGDTRLARVLDEVKKDGCGQAYDKTHLLVLAADDMVRSCGIRHVPLEDIIECLPVKGPTDPSPFAAFFLHPDFPCGLSQEELLAFQKRGTLDSLFIEKLFQVTVDVKRLPYPEAKL